MSTDHDMAIAPPRPRCWSCVWRGMGSFHQSRLVFMRILLRRMTAKTGALTRPVFDIDAKGVGHAVYSRPWPGSHLFPGRLCQ